MICPWCQSKDIDFPMVDVGVGEIQCGAAGCMVCHSYQINHNDHEELARATPEELNVGWFKGPNIPKQNQESTMGFFSEIFSLLFNKKPTPPPPPPTPPPPTPPPPANDIPSQLLVAHNAERAKKGLQPLVLESRLQKAAQGHADFMAKVRKMAHQRIGDGDPWSRINATGYPMSAGGENVAWNQQNIPEVMQDWMNSSGHRAAILGKYKEYGGAVAFGPNRDPYWCSVFATPAEGKGTFPHALEELELVMEAPPMIECSNGYLIEPFTFPESIENAKIPKTDH